MTVSPLRSSLAFILPSHFHQIDVTSRQGDVWENGGKGPYILSLSFRERVITVTFRQLYPKVKIVLHQLVTWLDRSWIRCRGKGEDKGLATCRELNPVLQAIEILYYMMQVRNCFRSVGNFL